MAKINRFIRLNMIKEMADRTETGSAENALALRNITKLDTGTIALHDVSLTVRKGEVHGLIGKNGAGKSTLVGIISGLVEPTGGEIEVNGETFRTLTPILARRRAFCRASSVMGQS